MKHVVLAAVAGEMSVEPDILLEDEASVAAVGVHIDALSDLKIRHPPRIDAGAALVETGIVIHGHRTTAHGTLDHDLLLLGLKNYSSPPLSPLNKYPFIHLMSFFISAMSAGILDTGQSRCVCSRSDNLFDREFHMSPIKVAMIPASGQNRFVVVRNVSMMIIFRNLLGSP